MVFWKLRRFHNMVAQRDCFSSTVGPWLQPHHADWLLRRGKVLSSSAGFMQRIAGRVAGQGELSANAWILFEVCVAICLWLYCRELSQTTPYVRERCRRNHDIDQVPVSRLCFTRSLDGPIYM